MNLLPRSEPRAAFQPLDPEQYARFESRLHALATSARSPEFLRTIERRIGDFEAALVELESEPSLITALDLLHEIDRVRVDAKLALGRDRSIASENSGKSSRVAIPTGEGGSSVCASGGAGEVTRVPKESQSRKKKKK